MLMDRYGLPLSTTSSAARDAYVEGCEAKLTMYPGTIEAFDRALAADPGFALAHAAKAHTLLERGNAFNRRAARHGFAKRERVQLITSLPKRRVNSVTTPVSTIHGDARHNPAGGAVRNCELRAGSSSAPKGNSRNRKR
jgi:hypothetical protein